MMNVAVSEPFISPSLYEKYVNNSAIPVVDEWSLSIAMGANLAEEMEEHYKTFIVRHVMLQRNGSGSEGIGLQTEKDFADIAGTF